MNNTFATMLINFVFLSVSLYMLYSVFVAINTSVRIIKKRSDEMEIKVLVDSLAFSMLVMMFVHIIQTIIGINFKGLYPNGIYVPVISSGVHRGAFLGNSPLHIESFIFDIFLFSVIYNINRLRYGIFGVQKFLSPIVVSLVLSVLLFIMIL